MKEAAKEIPSNLSLDELFKGMAERAFNSENARGWEAVIQYDITGEGGGQYYLVIKNQKCSLHHGIADNSTLAIHVIYLPKEKNIPLGGVR